MYDILTLFENITDSEQQGLGEKNGYFFLGSEFSFLIVMVNSGYLIVFLLPSQYLKMDGLKYHSSIIESGVSLRFLSNG